MHRKKYIKGTGASIQGRYKIISKKAGTNEVIRETDWNKNLVMIGADTGIGLICKRMAGDVTDSIAIDSASIGSGTTAPTDSDTDLETPVLTGIITTAESSTSNSVSISFFITDSQLTNGTYNEFGIFANLKLFARSIISPSFTKASGEDTTIVYEITFTNS